MPSRDSHVAPTSNSPNGVCREGEDLPSVGYAAAAAQTEESIARINGEMGVRMSSVGSEIYEWASRGACTTGDPDALFVQGAAQHRAKIVCSGCEVRTECLAEALDSQVEFGVWGGMTERERRAILRRRPDVNSWRALLLDARDNHPSQVIDLRTPRVGRVNAIQADSQVVKPPDRSAS